MIAILGFMIVSAVGHAQIGVARLLPVMTASAVDLPDEARLRRQRPGRDRLSLSLMFPVRRDVAPCLVQVDVLIDVVDPRDRNEMMMLTVGRTQLRELDRVRPVEMVDLSDPLSVG